MRLARSCDVAVRFVPAHRALERRGYRPLEIQFTLGARAIHKHHVPGDLHASTGMPGSRPTSREKAYSHRLHQRESMRIFRMGARRPVIFASASSICLSVRFHRQEIALADLPFSATSSVLRALFHANKIQAGLHVAGILPFKNPE